MILSENRFPPSDQVRGQAFSGSCLQAADKRAFHGVDGKAGHFAIAGQNCQHIDQAFGTAAEPRSYHGARHAGPGRAHGGRERNDLAGLGAAFALVEAGMNSLVSGIVDRLMSGIVGGGTTGGVMRGGIMDRGIMDRGIMGRGIMGRIIDRRGRRMGSFLQTRRTNTVLAARWYECREGAEQKQGTQKQGTYA
jgi:hypothetical protein